MRLTERKIAKASLPVGKSRQRLTDGLGLYVLLTNNITGIGKSWKFDYRYNGKRKTLTIGTWPKVSLEDAREIAIKAHRDLRQGIDPCQKKRIEIQQRTAPRHNFRSVAEEMLIRKQGSCAENTTRRKRAMLQQHVYPSFGHLKPDDITAPMVLHLLEGIADDGKLATSHRIKGLIGEVMRYACRKGLTTNDPTAALIGALPKHQHRHHPHPESEKDVAALMRAIAGYEDHKPQRATALKLAPLLLLRPGELCAIRRDWINIDQHEIRMPAEAMKMKRPHIVPLSAQAEAMIRRATQQTNSQYLFPAINSYHQPMCPRYLNESLRKLGFDTRRDVDAHGLRGMASTIANERLGIHPDVIELQLAHQEKNKVRAAYNHAQHMQARRQFLQQYADYLTTIAR